MDDLGRPPLASLASRPEVIDQQAIRCAECDGEVDEFTAIGEKWGYWSNGVGELVPFCPECSKREFRARRSCFGLVANTASPRQ